MKNGKLVSNLKKEPSSRKWAADNAGRVEKRQGLS
jgi:hypothetical protein